MTMIKNLRELAEHVGAGKTEGTDKEIAASIARRLYKDTESGICFHAPAEGDRVVVSGYCEGVDAECPPYEIMFPIDSDEFDSTVETADADACSMWNDTHGCEDCGLDGAVNPECETCDGDGIVL